MRSYSVVTCMKIYTILPIAEVVTGGVMKEGKLRTNSWWFTFINFNGVIHPEYGYLLNTNVEYDPSKRLIDLTPNVSDHQTKRTVN